MARGNSNGANLGFEKELGQAANALHANMDAAEYKHVLLGLMFTAELREQMKESARLDKIIWANLKDIGYGG